MPLHVPGLNFFLDNVCIQKKAEIFTNIFAYLVHLFLQNVTS